MASQALLAAASKLKAVPKKPKPKRAPKQSRPPSGSPLSGLPSDADSLAALLPDVVRLLVHHTVPTAGWSAFLHPVAC